MLELAINHKEALNKEYQMALQKQSNLFFSGSEWDYYELKLDDSDYYKIQYVSVDSNSNILGYFSAKINRNSNIITGIEVIKFKENTLASLDLFRFLKKIYEMPVVKIEWWVIRGNEAEKLYDKVISKYSGKKIGLYEKSIKLKDGKYYDKVFYEIIKENE
ncbi:MAG: hypothetical protein IMY67_11295 [Bacteroidetes bacterium]|nr:hypothetical protein [Bacteroidota bacterium]